MKIEKINDNQIRCTLTQADLADRELKLSELAYGTEKAKSLFHDMMQQAAAEFGFEAEDILDLINKVKEAVSEPPAKMAEAKKEEIKEAQNPAIRLFSFSNMDSVIHAAHLLKAMYFGSNTLYKDTSNNVFILALTQSEHTTNEYNKICNMLSEYGSLERASGATLAYLEEHCEVFIANNAVQQLAVI